MADGVIRVGLRICDGVQQITFVVNCCFKEIPPPAVAGISARNRIDANALDLAGGSAAAHWADMLGVSVTCTISTTGATKVIPETNAVTHARMRQLLARRHQ